MLPKSGSWREARDQRWLRFTMETAEGSHRRKLAELPWLCSWPLPEAIQIVLEGVDSSA